jgi:methionine aminotransferase
MSALATEHNAINLGQGFPDFPMDANLSALAQKAMADGHNQYAPMAGHIPLLNAIAEKVESIYNKKISSKESITITPGGTYAIYNAFTTILEPGDEVILFEPAYDSYIPNILVNGAIPIPIPLSFPDFSIDWEKVRKSITDKTKAIIINSPHNPTGTILSDDDMLNLSSILKNTSIYLISDEVYEHLIFEGKQHNSVLKYPELFERSFVCFSFGKVYNCTGWKLGYCIAPPTLTAEFRKTHQFNSFCCFTPTQVALAQHLKDKSAYESIGPMMQQKRDFFIERMKGNGFSLLPSYGSYFICASYERLSELPAKEFAVELIKKAGVASIPVSAFYHDGKDEKVLRFCFAKKEETIVEATKRLSALIN